MNCTASTPIEGQLIRVVAVSQPQVTKATQGDSSSLPVVEAGAALVALAWLPWFAWAAFLAPKSTLAPNKISVSTPLAQNQAEDQDFELIPWKRQPAQPDAQHRGAV